MSSNGNSHDPRIVLAGTAPAPLSSAQRDAQRNAMAQQLEAVTIALNQQGRAIMALREESLVATARILALEEFIESSKGVHADWLHWQQTCGRRLDAVERGAAVLSAWVRRPWWERLRARVGL